MKKYTTTIGIPAYNEANNIITLLGSLCNQEQKLSKIEKILIFSDGSTDETITKALSVGDPRIEVINSKQRMGKPTGVNRMFEHSSSDFFVLMDADLIIKDKDVVDNLIEPMVNNEKIDLTAGRSVPITLTTFAEKLANVSLQIWEEAKATTKNAEMYFCGGQIRAFRQRLYKTMIFPSLSADDAFAFLWCKKQGSEFKYAPKATVAFRLPSTIKDYVKQNKRFLHSREIQQVSFDKEFIKPFFTIGYKEKLLTFLSYFSRNTYWTSIYFIFFFILHLSVIFDREGMEATWNIVLTTKT